MVSNDSEMSNSVRNGKIIGGWLRFSVVVSVPPPVFFLSYVKCRDKTFLIFYLCSEIKTEPKNHGLHESGKSPPSLNLVLGKFRLT